MSSVFVPTLLMGKKIFVTGASSGIGKATALAMASFRADLVITGRNKVRLEATANEAALAKCLVVPMNLDNFDGITAWATGIAQQYGPFDGVFHAAGEALIKPMRLVRKKDYDQVFNPSLMAATALGVALSKKGCVNDGGAIVLMSSVAGSTGSHGMGLYSASKAGIDGLARAMAIELAPRRIRVNSVAAAAVRSELHARIEQNSSASTMADYEALHPLGFGNMADVANLVVYLISDAGRWITGAVLTVDGGYTAR